MKYKEFKAGKSLSLFKAGTAIFLILFAVILGFIRGWTFSLLPPLILAMIILVRIYRQRKKPLFLLYENEIVTFNPPRKIGVDKIVALNHVEENRMDLILTDGIPVHLFLHDLSKKDRIDLKQYFENIINQKNIG